MTANAQRPKRQLPLAVLVGLAAVPAVLIGGAWQYAEANVPPPTSTTTTTVAPPPAAALVTGLLSFRRHPTPLADEAAIAEADAIWEASVARLTTVIGTGSCLRVATADKILLDIGDAPVIPASNQKLFVAATALEVLGPDYRFTTELQSVAPALGVISGDIYLIGGGDPVLRTSDVPDPQQYPTINATALEALADQLVVLGVTTIDGNVVGDGSRYDDERRVPSWPDDITSAEAGPYDALLVNDGLISNGNYGLDPNRSGAVKFLELLRARGITVSGSAANSARPADADFTTLALIRSLPLTDVLAEMLQTSDDNTAEMMLKEIGFVATGQGTRQAGLDTIRATLERWGVPTDGLLMSDGSGLSRENRTTCKTLSALVDATPVAGQLVALLPVAGRSGTLVGQFLGTPAEATLAAKTGTLTGVKALTGLQPAGDGEPITFSLVLNGVLNGANVNEESIYQPIWNQLVKLVDQYPIVVVPQQDGFAPP